MVMRFFQACMLSRLDLQSLVLIPKRVYSVANIKLARYHFRQTLKNIQLIGAFAMEDLGGFGRAAEKFLALIESSIGTLYKPRSIRNEGRAQADADSYKIVTLARADKTAKLIHADVEQELAERAVARLCHQEMLKQSNIESIVDKAAEEIGDADIGDEVDQDWMHFFFESCATVSNEKVQGLWSKVLARKVTSRRELSRKMIDCLRWLDGTLADQFIELAPRLYLFDGFFAQDVELGKDKILKSISFPFNGGRLEEIGLVKENLGKMFEFKFGSLRIYCQELSDRNLRHRRFFELTDTGRQLARIVCPPIVEHDRARAGEGESSVADRWVLYSDAHNKADSILVPTRIREKMVIGQLIDFLIENRAMVMIEKNYVRRVLKNSNLSSDIILTIKVAGKNVVFKESRPAKMKMILHSIEEKLMVQFLECVKANESLIINNVK